MATVRSMNSLRVDWCCVVLPDRAEPRANGAGPVQTIPLDFEPRLPASCMSLSRTLIWILHLLNRFRLPEKGPWGLVYARLGAAEVTGVERGADV